MKKSIFIAVLGMAAVTSSSYGQGQVHFSNYFNSSSPKVTYADGTFAGQTVGSEMSAQLAYFIGNTADPSQLTPLAGSATFGLAGPTVPNGPYAGWFEGGNVTVPGSAGQPTVTFEILVFQTGSDYASSSVRGRSALFQGTTTANAQAPVPDFPQGAWQNFQVSSVPEPSTFALIGLGIGSMLFLRRRS